MHACVRMRQDFSFALTATVSLRMTMYGSGFFFLMHITKTIIAVVVPINRYIKFLVLRAHVEVQH